MAKDKLTPEFKRGIVRMYCFSHSDCKNCVLCVGGWDEPIPGEGYPNEECPSIAEATPRDIDRAYELIINALKDD